jgi:hypothetical protein
MVMGVRKRRVRLLLGFALIAAGIDCCVNLAVLRILWTRDAVLFFYLRICCLPNGAGRSTARLRLFVKAIVFEGFNAGVSQKYGK